jgi:hypothetical protein
MDQTKDHSADFPDLQLIGDEVNEIPLNISNKINESVDANNNITFLGIDKVINNISQSNKSITPVPANNETSPTKESLEKLFTEFTEEEIGPDPEGYKTIAVKKKPMPGGGDSILNSIINEKLTVPSQENRSTSSMNSIQPGTGIGWRYTNVKKKTTKPITNVSNVTNSNPEVTSPRIVQKGAKG